MSINVWLRRQLVRASLLDSDGIVIVLKKQVVLSDDNIKGLEDDPVLIVEAPGEGKAISLVKAIIRTSGFNANPYTNIQANSAITLYNGDGFGMPFQQDPNNYVTKLLTAPGFEDLWFIQQKPAFDPTSPGESFATAVEDQPVVFLASNNGGGPFTGGAATNRMAITVFYNIIDV